jgi:hypothetical protein
VHVSPRPNDSGGARIEKGFGRSELATKSDLKGNHPAGPNTPRYIVTPSRVTPKINQRKQKRARVTRVVGSYW